ncbi:MAG: methylmalonyl-CoA mutase family protein [Myxococcota bacterium]
MSAGRPLFATFDAAKAPEEAWRGLKGTDSEGPLTGLAFEAAPLPVRASPGFALWTRHSAPALADAITSIERDVVAGVEGIWLRCGLDDGIRLLTAGDLDSVLKACGGTDVLLEGDEPLGLAAFLLASGQTQGGGVATDPFRTLAEHGRLDGGFRSAFAEMRAVGALLAPTDLSTVMVNTAGYDGAEASDHIAFALATLVEYVRVFDGAEPTEVLSRARIAVPVGTEFFEAIAMLRALRLTLTRVCKACGFARTPPIHALSSSYGRSVRAPHTNLLRGTAEAFGAIVGGADAVAVSPFDGLLAATDELAERMARNTAMLLRAEGRLGAVADPAAGSYLIEGRTQELALEGWERFQELEALGGMERAVRTGVVARRVDAAREVRERGVRQGEHAVVGATHFAQVDETPLDRKAPDLRHVMVELGEPLPKPIASSAEERDAQAKALHAALRNGDSKVAADAALQLAQWGADLMTLRDASTLGRPSLYVPPLAHRRAAQSYEELADRVRRRTELPRMLLCVLAGGDADGARAVRLLESVGIAYDRREGDVGDEPYAGYWVVGDEAQAQCQVLAKESDPRVIMDGRRGAQLPSVSDQRVVSWTRRVLPSTAFSLAVTEPPQPKGDALETTPGRIPSVPPPALEYYEDELDTLERIFDQLRGAAR